MPNSVRVSMWLLIASAIATPLVSLLDPTPIPQLPEGAVPLAFLAFVGFFVPFFGVLIFFAVMAYRRRNWARWVHSAILLISSAVYVPLQAKAFEVSASLAVLNVILTVIELASLVLLFTRESNAWYRASVVTAA
jgi:hypothetical protein